MRTFGGPSDVVVVVPSWKSEHYLSACLETCARQDGVSVRVVVVDNGSTDDSAQVALGHGIRVIRLPRNLGFARAVNRGAATGTEAFIAVVNADAFLAPTCLATLVNKLSARPDAAGAQPRILQHEDQRDGRPRRLYSIGQRLTRSGRAFEIGAGEPDGPRFATPRELFGVCGAACLLRREAFEQLGGYDERFFAFYEDVDFNIRA